MLASFISYFHLVPLVQLKIQAYILVNNAQISVNAKLLHVILITTLRTLPIYNNNNITILTRKTKVLVLYRFLPKIIVHVSTLFAID